MISNFKEKLDRFMESKYVSNIAIAIIAIIIVIIGILVYREYKKPNSPIDDNVNIYDNVDVYGDVDIYDNVDIYDGIGSGNKDNSANNTDESNLFATELDVITKGKKVGKAVAKDIDTSNLHQSVKNSLGQSEKLEITKDTVISLDLLALNENTRSKITSINSKIFNEDGRLVLDNNISSKYDRATIAVDTLPEGSTYYAVVTITLDNAKSETYIFKF